MVSHSKHYNFPILAKDVIDDILRELYVEFGLNEEQQRIAQLIADWFTPSPTSASNKRGSRSHKNDVILVLR